MKSFLKISWPFILLAVLSFTIHFAFLSYPSQVVFDEVHFGKFVAAYFTGQYYFDIHPPLGKLLIAAFVKLTGVNPIFDFSQIGEQAAPNLFFAMRFLPAFFGSLFVLLFSWLAYLISRSKKAAIIAGFLILLDNAFLVQSKFILVDIFLIFFEVLTLCFFFLYQRQKRFGLKWFAFLILAALSFGLTISAKWTGLATIGIIGVILLVKIFSRKLADYLNPDADWLSFGIRFSEGLIGFVIFMIIGFSVYIVPFAIHLKLLPHSGPGDAFMSANWQQELKYGRDNVYQPLSFPQKFLELNKVMLKANAGITAEHPYGSRWYSWPLGHKPVYYWTEKTPASGKTANIYFAGNPFLWWLMLVSIVSTAILILSKKGRHGLASIFHSASEYNKRELPNENASDMGSNNFWHGVYILFIAYFANLLPFILIKRVSFLYHYLPSAIFGIMLTALFLSGIYRKKTALAIIFIFLSAGFLVLAPLSYGWPIPSWLNGIGINLMNL